jgi:acyl-CoA dehydrogenase
MSRYRAPIADIAHVLKHVAGLDQVAGRGRFDGVDEALALAVIEEAGRFAAERIVPLRPVGDRHGVRLENGAVTTAPGWKELYRDWREAGWNSLSGPVGHGGQGLPHLISVAAQEIWNSGSMGFAVGPLLTMGAVEALVHHGSQELQRTYLGKLVSGEWMGTMNLTEPHAGSDLSGLRTRAEPQGDGTYRIFGQKIFITYGEHDLTDNIVHLVLARLPDAPAGTRGLSLFLVPKILPDGSRNDLFCQGIEHKLGIHASPTCTMIYGEGRFGERPGAIGWLVGEENRGLACMFTMMNNARLAVGMQGIAVAEAAFQLALAHARERRQGRAADDKGAGMSPIVLHPDVQRSLLTMKALIQAARSLAYACAHALDMMEVDEARREYWQGRADLLTPLAKAFSTDIGVEVASIGIQVHGGMGFIEETGAAQLLRDARIAPIYEGTNGIQAIDLVTRKLPMADGAVVGSFLAELEEIAGKLRAAAHPGLGTAVERLEAALADLRSATGWMEAALRQGRRDEALAGATPYLRLMSLAAAGVLLAKGALSSGEESRLALCRFLADNLLGETAALRQSVETGAGSLKRAAAMLLE